jgi:GT2 family glycosyltransferase
VPRLTAIVPAKNGLATLAPCARAIHAAADSPEELIVVTKPPTVGPVVARNVGARQATGDVLVFVDADVLVHDDVFRRIRAAFDADPALTAVFGSYDDAPAAPGVVSVFRNLLHHHVHQSSPGPATTFWTGLGAVRRDAFMAVGGFDDERFNGPEIEDIELGARLVDAGARIVLDPSIQGTHLKAWSLRAMVTTDFLHRGVPWVKLLLRNREAPSELNLAWRHRVSAVACLTALFGLVARRPAASIAASMTFLGLNRRFYRLLLARRGPVQAVAGVGLHALHHLTAVASVPAGLWSHVQERRQTRLAEAPAPVYQAPPESQPREPHTAEPLTAEPQPLTAEPRTAEPLTAEPQAASNGGPPGRFAKKTELVTENGGAEPLIPVSDEARART